MLIFTKSYQALGERSGSVVEQCSHSKFKLGVFIPPHFDIWDYEMKFWGMTFWDGIKLLLGHAWKDYWHRKCNFLTGQIACSYSQDRRDVTALATQVNKCTAVMWTVNFNIMGTVPGKWWKMGRIYSNSLISSSVCAYFEGKTLSFVPPRLFWL